MSTMTVAGLVAVAVLAGCSNGDDPAPEPTDSESTEAPTEDGTDEAPEDGGATEAPTALPPAEVQNELPTDLPDDPALRTSVLLTGCGEAEGGWQGTGTAANPGGEDLGYQIIVFFTDAYSRAVDSSTITVEVPAGETVEWSAAKEFAPPEGTQCVLRAVAQLE
ncbi:hypothetical protein [Serinibacter arcticus]|uniref:hypothetical protein n=1 Tax=Serinibacter arcticus TaxID=1655435 RepID=UPI001304F2FA|nr:hypothetical protein [Serinibacter arcticus]